MSLFFEKNKLKKMGQTVNRRGLTGSSLLSKMRTVEGRDARVNQTSVLSFTCCTSLSAINRQMGEFWTYRIDCGYRYWQSMDAVTLPIQLSNCASVPCGMESWHR